MLDPAAPPRHPAIARALGVVRAALARLPSQRGGLRRPRRLLVACSGGADSMAALGLLVLLRRSAGLELVVGHVDHGLRAESVAEAELVARVAGDLGLPFEHTRLELRDGPGLPARAREARRTALIAQADRSDCAFVVLAHTATDQAETMLMHLTRGAGLDGFGAMPALDGRWLRCVLELTRAETRALTGLLDLPFVDDPTNEDLDQLRVWLRTAVLAPLRERNPELDRAMCGLSRDVAEADAALEEWAAREEAARLLQNLDLDSQLGSELGFRWTLDGFEQLPRAVRTRVLRRMCERGGVDLSELRRRVIDELDGAAHAMALALGGPPGSPRPGPSRWDLHPRRQLRIDKNGVHAAPAGTWGAAANH